MESATVGELPIEMGPLSWFWSKLLQASEESLLVVAYKTTMEGKLITGTVPLMKLLPISLINSVLGINMCNYKKKSEGKLKAGSGPSRKLFCKYLS